METWKLDQTLDVASSFVVGIAVKYKIGSIIDN
jgi:hypothetical protein